MNCESKYKQANIWGQTSKQGELCTMVSKIGARALVGHLGAREDKMTIIITVVISTTTPEECR